jgi:hypothetical protein
MDFMQDYQHSSPGQIHTSDLGKNEFEGSSEFSNAFVFHYDTWMSELQDTEDTLQRFAATPGDGPEGSFQRRNEARQVQQAGTEYFNKRPELQVLAKEFMKAKNQLYDRQREAGTKMGFNHVYGPARDEYKPEGIFVSQEQHIQRSAGTVPSFLQERTQWDDDNPGASPKLEGNGWTLYQDNSWEFGQLNTSEQLHDMMQKIEESGDADYIGTEHYRSEDQRGYLAQKAYTRYLYGKINEFGGFDYINKKDFWDASWADKQQKEIYQKNAQDYEWGLDPMYSEEDDKDLPPQAYGIGLGDDWGHTPQLVLKHTDDWTEGSLFGRPDWIADTRYGSNMVYDDGSLVLDKQAYNRARLQDAGIITDNTSSDPDYIAGRFQDEETFRGLDTPDEPEPEPEPAAQPEGDVPFVIDPVTLDRVPMEWADGAWNIPLDVLHTAFSHAKGFDKKITHWGGSTDFDYARRDNAVMLGGGYYSRDGIVWGPDGKAVPAHGGYAPEGSISAMEWELEHAHKDEPDPEVDPHKDDPPKVDPVDPEKGGKPPPGPDPGKPAPVVPDPVVPDPVVPDPVVPDPVQVVPDETDGASHPHQEFEHHGVLDWAPDRTAPTHLNLQSIFAR